MYLRGDWRLKRGLGGGIETRYRSTDHKELFQTINYVARDVSLFNRHERFRYRFQGIYNNTVWDDKFTVNLTYDKLSDEDMAADYADQSLELVPSGRTQLDIHRQEDSWISNFVTRVRFNNFETVKQQLPTLQVSWKPFVLSRTGIISDNQFEASYLDFAYANDLPHTHDYHSARISLFNRLYRPFVLGPVTMTPEVGNTSILYGNSQDGSLRWVVLGVAGLDLNAPFYRCYSFGKHVFTPYSRYQYYSFPTTSPNKHYIFDIDDGWYRVSRLRFGMTHSLYNVDEGGNIFRTLHLDLYANAFFDIDTIPQTIPKMYADLVWNSSPTLRHSIDTAWDFEESQLDHFNFRTQWTVNADFAVALEYRHRDAFDWRKADHDNFVIDCFRSIEDLRHSALSDRRDTALLQLFYRFHPNWAVAVESLQGWNRKDRKRYNEFEIDLVGILRSASQVKIAYQHRVGDNRVAIYFSMGPKRPDYVRTGDYIPRLSF